MSRGKKIAAIGLALSVGFAATTAIAARLRENRVLQIKPGMKMEYVERLLGAGVADVMPTACQSCPKDRKQFAYAANPSLWYGRFEDNLVVCYNSDVVCAITRVGL